MVFKRCFASNVHSLAGFPTTNWIILNWKLEAINLQFGESYTIIVHKPRFFYTKLLVNEPKRWANLRGSEEAIGKNKKCVCVREKERVSKLENFVVGWNQSGKIVYVEYEICALVMVVIFVNPVKLIDCQCCRHCLITTIYSIDWTYFG